LFALPFSYFKLDKYGTASKLSAVLTICKFGFVLFANVICYLSMNAIFQHSLLFW